MEQIPDNVRHEIIKLVPSCVVNEITCFVFYDNHPIQRKMCDITVCTVRGEVKEYYKREEVSSLLISSDFKASHARIMRNSRCALFYLVASDSEVVILSRREKLRVHQRVSNVDYYDVEDSVCRGQACLKIVKKDDAVPLIFDDKFENLGERANVMSGINVDDSLPILTELKRKLTQAKYSIKCNEKTHREFKDLRKLTAFAAYQKSHPNLSDSMVHGNHKEEYEALKLKCQSPQVKTCNQKVVITLHVVNKNKEPLTDVTVLLHASKKTSIVYTTKLFERKTTSPFWKRVSNILQPEVETALVVVVDLSELQCSPASKVDFNGVVSYRRSDKKCLLPFDYVVISHLEVMEKQFDVLSQQIDDVSILFVLATTEKVDLCLRIISNMDYLIPLPDLFCQYLKMESVNKVHNAVIHKKSPYHILNGVLVIFMGNKRSSNTFSLAVHVRSDAQILPLVHYIHEAIPNRLIVTSPNHRITTTIDSLRIYNEEIPKSISPKLNYKEYSTSIMKQTEMILEYLDSCIVKMNSSKDSATLSKIGKEIDLFAGGLAFYKELRTKLLEEALNGVKSLKSNEVRDSGSMLLDNE